MEAENKKKINPGEVIILVCIAAVCIYMIIASRDFKLLGRLFPQVVSACTLLGCVIQAVLLVKKPAAPKKAKPAGPALKNHLTIAVIGIVYLVLLPFIGFIPMTVALMVAVPLYLGYKNQVVIWTLAILFTGVFYYVFKTIFFVPLPQGLITFI